MRIKVKCFHYIAFFIHVPQKLKGLSFINNEVFMKIRMYVNFSTIGTQAYARMKALFMHDFSDST